MMIVSASSNGCRIGEHAQTDVAHVVTLGAHLIIYPVIVNAHQEGNMAHNLLETQGRSPEGEVQIMSHTTN
jgi:hypothetical protein